MPARRAAAGEWMVDRHAVEKDFAGIERMDAADAFDERRLARAIVAEQGQHLAAIGVQADALERMHRAETLLRVAHRENRSVARPRSLRASPPEGARARASSWLRSTSASTATTMMRPMAIIWKKTSTL